MGKSNNSDKELRFVEKSLKLRKRKKYINCDNSQKWRNREYIASQLDNLSRVCSSLGLKIDEIILSPIFDNNNTEETKITINENFKTKESHLFEILKAKDKINMSQKKYKLLKSTLHQCKTIRLPGIELVDKLKHELDNFFAIKSNNDGFYIDPVKKIKFVCEKFINKNPNFSKNKFKIKISADSTSISRTNTNLLNVTFNLLDDAENCSSVFGSIILGNYFFLFEFF